MRLFAISDLSAFESRANSIATNTSDVDLRELATLVGELCVQCHQVGTDQEIKTNRAFARVNEGCNRPSGVKLGSLQSMREPIG